MILGDLNSGSKSKWNEDINLKKGSKIDSLKISYDLQQIISDSTHILPTSCTFIGLMFTDQPKLIVDRGVHPSLQTNCY